MSAKVLDSKSTVEIKEEGQEVVTAMMTLNQVYYFYTDISLNEFLWEQKIKQPNLFFIMGKYLSRELAERAYKVFLGKYKDMKEEELQAHANSFDWEDKFKPDSEVE